MGCLMRVGGLVFFFCGCVYWTIHDLVAGVSAAVLCRHDFLGGRGLWVRENGTICPFGVFTLFHSNFWPNLRPTPGARPVVVL